MNSEASHNHIAGRVKQYRKKLGFTQEDLAVVSGMPTSNISRIERGVVVPNTATIVKLAEALEVTPNDLLLEDIDQPPLLLDGEIASLASGLSASEKVKVIDYISFLKYMSGKL